MLRQVGFCPGSGSGRVYMYVPLKTLTGGPMDTQHIPHIILLSPAITG